MDRDQGLPRDVERGFVRADGRGQVVAQGDDGEQADRADPVIVASIVREPT